MRIGILSDTHDQLARTQVAVQLLQDAGAEALFHCGDFIDPEIGRVCTVLPFYFVLGNNDIHEASGLQRMARQTGATCLGWGGMVELASRKIGVVHGHRRSEVRRLEALQPAYLLSGHTHLAADHRQDGIRRINPGALFRASEFSVALLDLHSDQLEFLAVSR